MTKWINTLRQPSSGAVRVAALAAAVLLVGLAALYVGFDSTEPASAQRSSYQRRTSSNDRTDSSRSSDERASSAKDAPPRDAAAKAANTARPASTPPAIVPAHLAKKEDFAIIVDRNIFDRYRRPPVVRTAPQPQPERPPYTPPPPQPPVDTDRYFVLLGIGLEGDQYTAFFEDTRAGKIMLLQPGEAVGKGKLLAVNLDSVQYERGAKRQVIKVGYTLTGVQADTGGFATAPAPAAAPAPRPAAPTATPTTGPAATGPAATQPDMAVPAPPAEAAPNPELNDIIERLKRKRQQEMGV